MCMHEGRSNNTSDIGMEPSYVSLILKSRDELGFEVEGDKYNFFERGKYNFLWTYFLKS